MNIYVEAIGGPDDGELIATKLDVYFAMPPQEDWDWWSQKDPVNTILPTINYYRERRRYHFCGKHYYREFFICGDDKRSNGHKALKIMDSYFNPVFLRPKKGG
ncbi:hypothetical protein [Acinetobacter pittii]|uniref:hypothetical protein n=1 Tax=Acinetobacter pittii TaxID=48296 RepID=UPI00227019A7|nr:hypothetical protein [Acinetobacter pittii]